MSRTSERRKRRLSGVSRTNERKSFPYRPSPRSPSLTIPSRDTNTLAGLTSLWMIRSPCM